MSPGWISLAELKVDQYGRSLTLEDFIDGLDLSQLLQNPSPP